MIRLAYVELRRLAARRLMRLVAVLGVIVVLGVVATIAVQSSRDTSAAMATAQRMAQEQAPYQQQAVQQCEASPQPAGQPSCEEMVGPPPTAQNFFQDPRFHFAEHARDLVTGATFILILLGLSLGASFLGAEWQAGTLSSLLTWEPRRLRVLAAKLAAATVGATVLSAMYLALLLGGAAAAAGTRGTLEGSTTAFVGHLLAMAGRGLGLVALFTLAGAALAALTRHTAAALGIVGGYLVAGELVGALVSSRWHNHALGSQILAFLQGRLRYYVDTRTFDGGFSQTEHYLHAPGAALVIGLVVAGLVAVAAVFLTRRDVG